MTREIKKYPIERVGLDAPIYDKGYKNGYKKGQEDAFNGKIENLETLTITETVNVIPELQEYFEKKGIDNFKQKLDGVIGLYQFNLNGEQVIKISDLYKDIC